MSSIVTPQLQPEQVFGIAKKMCLELEKLNISEQSAVISMLHTMCVHRENRMKFEMQQAQIDAQEAAMADARRAHAQAQVQREAKMAGEIKAVIDEPKPPRLSIVLDKAAPDAHLGAVEDATGCPSADDLDAVEAEKQVAEQTEAVTA